MTPLSESALSSQTTNLIHCKFQFLRLWAIQPAACACGPLYFAWKYPSANDSHPNARKYRIDSQTLENTSHFAMRISLFSSLLHSNKYLVLSYLYKV